MSRGTCGRRQSWRLSEIGLCLGDLDDGRAAPCCDGRGAKEMRQMAASWMKRVRVLAAMYALQKSDLDLKQTAATRTSPRQSWPGTPDDAREGPAQHDPALAARVEEAKQGDFWRVFPSRWWTWKKTMLSGIEREHQWRNVPTTLLARIRPNTTWSRIF